MPYIVGLSARLDRINGQRRRLAPVRPAPRCRYATRAAPTTRTRPRCGRLPPAGLAHRDPVRQRRRARVNVMTASAHGSRRWSWGCRILDVAEDRVDMAADQVGERIRRAAIGLPDGVMPLSRSVASRIGHRLLRGTAGPMVTCPGMALAWKAMNSALVDPHRDRAAQRTPRLSAEIRPRSEIPRDVAADLLDWRGSAPAPRCRRAPGRVACARRGPPSVPVMPLAAGLQFSATIRRSR